jgi:hypothetical protein
MTKTPLQAMGGNSWSSQDAAKANTRLCLTLDLFMRISLEKLRRRT